MIATPVPVVSMMYFLVSLPPKMFIAVKPAFAARSVKFAIWGDFSAHAIELRNARMNKAEKFDRRDTGKYARGPEFIPRLNSRAHALEGQGKLLLRLLRAIIFPSETPRN